LTEITAAQAYRQLQRRAREERRGTEELLVLYSHEAFLRRLAMSSYRDKLVLKGGMLLAVMDARRPTRDADLSAHGIANDPTNVSEVMSRIAEVVAADGVVFDTAKVTTTSMRAEAEYHGVRVIIPAQLSTARIKVQLDVSFGDPIDVTEVDYPTLLDDQKIRLLGYPMELVLAEKIATMMSRGQANTRDRDFADVVSLSRAHPVEGQRLRDTIERIAKHRGHDVLILRDALGDLSERRQSSWTALRQRSGLNTLPESFAALVAETLRFVDPLIDDGRRARRWIPDEGRWSA
jgi:predicted nucleotidyltransferase component of viral defense system